MLRTREGGACSDEVGDLVANDGVEVDGDVFEVSGSLHPGFCRCQGQPAYQEMVKSINGVNPSGSSLMCQVL